MVLLFVVCGWREEAVAGVFLRTSLVHSTYVFLCTRATKVGKIVNQACTVSSTIGFRIFLGYPFGRGISQNLGRYLDIRLCSIPTVGVYEKQGKLHLTRSTSYLLYFIHLRSALPPPSSIPITTTLPLP
jgi:hypothetical protein